MLAHKKNAAPCRFPYVNPLSNKIKLYNVLEWTEKIVSQIANIIWNKNKTIVLRKQLNSKSKIENGISINWAD